MRSSACLLSSPCQSIKIVLTLLTLSSIFTIGPVDEALATTTGYPFIELFYRATGSLSATNAMTAIMIINLTASSIAVLATASRQLWAFARNQGLPGSSWLAPNILPGDIPLAALFVSLFITICLSLINIGSSAALNAIFSLNTGSLITSYMITIGCTIIHRLSGRELPPARFTLGRWGLPINVLAMCFLIPVFLFSFFPGTPNPTAQTMNWGIIMYGGVIILATVYYMVRGRYHYTPPDETIKDAALDVDTFYAHGEDAPLERDREVRVQNEKRD
jgi:amino acid transporter